MSAKSKKSDVLSYLQKSKVNFLLEVILFLWTKGFYTHPRICVNANMRVFEGTHESRLWYVLRSLYGLHGQRSWL